MILGNNFKALCEGEPELLVFHTLFGEEFSGATAEEVVAALYEDSNTGLDISFAEWWSYQTELWRKTRGLRVPGPEEKDACRKLLDVMVRAGALETGPLPRKSCGEVTPGV